MRTRCCLSLTIFSIATLAYVAGCGGPPGERPHPDGGNGSGDASVACDPQQTPTRTASPTASKAATDAARATPTAMARPTTSTPMPTAMVSSTTSRPARPAATRATTTTTERPTSRIPTPTTTASLITMRIADGDGAIGTCTLQCSSTAQCPPGDSCSLPIGRRRARHLCRSRVRARRDRSSEPGHRRRRYPRPARGHVDLQPDLADESVRPQADQVRRLVADRVPDVQLADRARRRRGRGNSLDHESDDVRWGVHVRHDRRRREGRRFPGKPLGERERSGLRDSARWSPTSRTHRSSATSPCACRAPSTTSLDGFDTVLGATLEITTTSQIDATGCARSWPTPRSADRQPT